MSRRKGRIIAFQALYAWEASKAALEDLLQFDWLDEETRRDLSPNDMNFSRLLVSGTIENVKAIDKRIRACLQNWDFSRLKRVDLAVLRISIYALLYQTDIPPSVVIEEAVKICIEYGEDNSFRFINGVLDTIKKEIAVSEL